VVVNPVRPVVVLPDVALIFAFHAVIIASIRRMVKTIYANNAVNDGAFTADLNGVKVWLTVIRCGFPYRALHSKMAP
jgi:hypothetical protein